MPKFSYIAHNVDGKEKSGTLNAANQAAATAHLRRKGLFPKELVLMPTPEKQKRAARPLSTSIQLPAALSTVSPKQLMIFTRQMSTLIQAGLPLLRGLKMMERQERNPALKKAQQGLVEAIENGSTFADALAHYPRIFNRLFINMVRAGEAGGMLDVVLERLAEYMEKAQKVKNRILSAMTYPLVVLTVSTAIVIFLMTHIIPKFEALFQDMLDGQALPRITLLVMNISETMAAHKGLLFGGGALLLALPALMRQTQPGRKLTDYMRLHLSPLRTLTRQSLLARFARTLGTLLESGVPILQALTIVKGTLNNELLGEAVQEIHDRIKEGDPMAVPVAAHPLFPPVFTGMIEVGEETGQLPQMLAKMADLYEDEVDNTVSALSSIIEPLLIVLLALFIGTIVIALFLPMTSLIGNLK